MMVHIIPRVISSGNSFKDLLIIVETMCRYIRWIFYGCGDGRATGDGYHVYGVGYVRGRNQRVDLLEEKNVIFMRFFLKVMNE